jgi:hypothetical protein
MKRASLALVIGICIVGSIVAVRPLASGQGDGASAGSITRIVITERKPAFGGVAFGSAGPYEFVLGTAYGELDPKSPLNAAVADIQYAPVDARGRVEYSMDFTILKPVDINRGNGRLIYDVMNRGHEKALWTLNLSTLDPKCVTSTAAATPQCLGTEPADVSDPGTAFIMKRGYTVAWSGWQAEHSEGMASRPGLLRANFPIALQNGKPLVGISRDEFTSVPNGPTFTKLLTYTAANLDQTQATLTVREREQDPWQPLPASSWSYVDNEHVRVTAAPGFDREALYEFVYPATDMVLEGVAYPSIRDFVSFLRNAGADSTGAPNPFRPAKPYTAVFALGSYVLKDFLYEDFNRDAAGRVVFDGMMPLLTGTNKFFVNYPFGQPSRLTRQHEDHLYPGDQFPFTYATTHDPKSGKTDGLLIRCTVSHSCPKIIHFDSDTEYWQVRASLVTTDTQGHALGLPPNVRVFTPVGVPHNSTPLSAAGVGPLDRGICQQPRDQLQYRYYVRALFADLDAWVTAGVAPPASRYPNFKDGTLVPVAQLAQNWPAIPGLPFSPMIDNVRLTDYSTQPPTVTGDPYPIFVSAVNADGNPIGGIVPPEITVPLATYSGRNFRAKGFAEGELCDLSGSQTPFALTKAERLASGDSRLSVEERYRDQADFTAQRTRAAEALVQARLLLPEDAATIEAAKLPVPTP